MNVGQTTSNSAPQPDIKQPAPATVQPSMQQSQAAQPIANSLTSSQPQSNSVASQPAADSTGGDFQDDFDWGADPFSAPQPMASTQQPVNNSQPAPMGGGGSFGGGWGSPWGGGSAGGWGDPWGAPAGGQQPGQQKRLTPQERVEMIERVYQQVLVRKPDTRDINYYKYSTLGEEEIKKQLIDGKEHKQLIEDGRNYKKSEERAEQAEARVRMLEGQVKDQLEEFRHLTELLEEKNRFIQRLRSENDVQYGFKSPTSNSMGNPNQSYNLMSTPSQPAPVQQPSQPQVAAPITQPAPQIEPQPIAQPAPQIEPQQIQQPQAQFEPQQIPQPTPDYAADTAPISQTVPTTQTSLEQSTPYATQGAVPTAAPVAAGQHFSAPGSIESVDSGNAGASFPQEEVDEQLPLGANQPGVESEDDNSGWASNEPSSGALKRVFGKLASIVSPDQ
ncbi:MAG: hypothetical protein QY318_04405 [Candidatus Dojkabacteria bacterium]|nr:MAG: hypothetical protein QY318_04405 [Candidatus Dojkabacteria bacterium]